MPSKYNAVSKAPEAVEKLISLINALPSDLKKFKDDFDKLCNCRQTIDGKTHIVDPIWEKQGSVAVWKGAEKPSSPEVMSEEFIEYIFNRDPETNSSERFESLLKARSLFRKFAELSEAYMSLTKDKRDKLKHDPEQQYLFFLHFLTINYKDREFSGLLGFRFPDLYIKPVTNDFIQIFQDFDIPFFRIRACPICNIIYWASKLNSETCGKKECSNALGNQKRSKSSKKLSSHFISRVAKNKER